MLKDIFQFIAVSGTVSLNKILSGESFTKSSVIFDLEDGIQDVIHPEKTKSLKQVARKKFFSEFQDNTPGATNKKLGIRINSWSTEDFKCDITFLAETSRKIQWQYIVVPKINSGDEINYYLKTFSENNISFAEIIPIIETVKGFNDLDYIISQNPTAEFHRVFWGHHDYNLDAGYFPFVEHRSAKYWELTKQLIDKLEKRGYGYIGGACTGLGDDEFLTKIVSALAALCSNDFDHAALSWQQAKVLFALTEIVPLSYSILIEKNKLTHDEKIQLAEKTIDQFKEHLLNGKSFSINKKNQQMISPQQYKAAVRFLYSVQKEA